MKVKKRLLLCFICHMLVKLSEQTLTRLCGISDTIPVFDGQLHINIQVFSPCVDPVLSAEGILHRQPPVVQLQCRETALVQADHLAVTECAVFWVTACADRGKFLGRRSDGNGFTIGRLGASATNLSPESDFLAYFLLCPRMIKANTRRRMKMRPISAITTRNHHSS